MVKLNSPFWGMSSKGFGCNGLWIYIYFFWMGFGCLSKGFSGNLVSYSMHFELPNIYPEFQVNFPALSSLLSASTGFHGALFQQAGQSAITDAAAGSTN